jgi:DnaA family protein
VSEQQLILGLIEESPPALEQVVVGENGEAWAWLQRLGHGERPPEGRLLLWGGPASGKTAAIQALSRRLREQSRHHHLITLNAAEQSQQDLTPAQHSALAALDEPLLIDNLEFASPVLQQALFARLVGVPSSALLVASAGQSLQSLGGLGFREDLRTRLAQGLVYPLAPLGESEQLQVLRQKAQALGWMARPDDTQFDGIFLYMLQRMPRHLGWLCGLLQAVNQAALAQKRPISVPLLRNVAEGFSTTP